MRPSLPEDLLMAFSGFVEARIGLHIPQNRLVDLERGVSAAAREAAWSDTEAFIQHLMNTPVTQDVENMLAAHLTIGETYFYRDPRAFEVFEKEVLPQLLQDAARKEKTLRIWSAACCTGEEPYSIAMAVRRVLGEHSSWKVRILATDLNPRFLRRAAHGIYGRWSFRTLSDDMRARFFHKHSDDRWAIDERVKNSVTFKTLNFVDDPFPSAANETDSIDVIFCRNVLMYFSKETASRIIGKLRECLVQGGWLFTSATDAPRELFTGFDIHAAEGTVIYRRQEQKAPPANSLTLPAPVNHARPGSEKANHRTASISSKIPRGLGTEDSGRHRAPSPPISLREENANAVASSELCHRARSLADQGSFDEALATIDRAIECDKLEPLGHYLRGVILHERNSDGEAALSLQRALYLDPAFVLAHVTLGSLMRRGGKEKAARRCFDNAREILGRYGRDEVLPDSGGMTAGRLLHMISTPQSAVA